MATLSLQQRLDRSKSPLLRKLYTIMQDKQTNLCLAADNMTIEETLKLVESVGRHICILKIHALQFGTDRLTDNLKLLYESKRRHNFLLFEDAKFYDGYETVRGIYEKSFAKYVDMVTVSPQLGDEIFRAIEDGSKSVGLGDDEPRGCLAVCELSFANAVLPDGQKLLEIAERNSPICIGIIGQKLEVTDKDNMIKATPGVNLSSSGDGRGQQWRKPDQVLQDGADVVIVGRGITKAHESEWESLAIKYKEQCFSSL